MALFKILRGNEENLPAQINSGWCYYTLDGNRFYIDTDQGRKCINDIPESLADLLSDSTHRTVTDAQITQWSQAQPNQNAFSNVVVGTTTLSADSATDSLTLVAGTNVTLTPNANNDSVTIAVKDTTYTLTQDSTDGHKFTLTPSSGSPTTITIPDANTTYTLTVSGNNLVFTPSSGAGTTITVPYATNAGTVNGHTVNSDVPANAEFTDTVYTHPTSGVSAGTYRSVTVNANGHVTAGTNPTTLSGYGITDALSSSLKGANNGLAELDSSGKVPAAQLPSYVDDVLEYTSKSAFPTTGETGKIYVDTTANLTYRWGGSAYIEISPSLALGETSSTAYRGDRGKIAYDHSQATHARTDATKTEASSTNGNIKINGTETTVYTHPSGTNPHGTTKSDVGLGNVGNFKAVSTVASQGLTDTEKANARTNIGAGTSSLALGSTASTAAAGNHTHELGIATSDGTNQITLESGTKYQLTAGGSTYIFTTPANTTVDSFEECTSADIDEVFENS